MKIIEKLKNYRKYIKYRLLRNREIVVVEISQASCKSIVYDNSKTQGISFYWANENIDDRNMEKNFHEVDNMSNCISELKKELLKEDFNLATMLFVVNLVDSSCVGTLELPILPEGDLKEALAWEISQRIPWEISNTEYRYQNKLSNFKTDEEALADIQELEFYALLKETIKTVVDVFTQQNLRLCCLTVGNSIYSDIDEQTMVNKIDFFAGFYNKQKLENLHKEFDNTILTAIKYCQGKINIDFLSTKQHYEVISNLLEKLSKGMICLLLGLSLVIIGIVKGINIYEQQQRDNLQAKLQKLAVWEKRLLATQEQDRQRKQLQEMIKQVENRKIKWSEHLTKISNCLPEKCWLTKLEQETGKQNTWLVLYGKAENIGLVTKLVNDLQEKGKYSKVELLYSNNLPGNKSFVRPITDYKLKIKLL